MQRNHEELQRGRAERNDKETHQRMTPKEKTSALQVAFSYSSTSGAVQWNVPTPTYRHTLHNSVCTPTRHDTHSQRVCVGTSPCWRQIAGVTKRGHVHLSQVKFSSHVQDVRARKGGKDEK